MKSEQIRCSGSLFGFLRRMPPKKKKLFIDPFNQLELANQISKLRLILTKEIGDRQVTT